MQTTSKEAKGVILQAASVRDLFARISSIFSEREAPVMAVERGDELTLYVEDGTVRVSVNLNEKGGAL